MCICLCGVETRFIVKLVNSSSPPVTLPSKGTGHLWVKSKTSGGAALYLLIGFTERYLCLTSEDFLFAAGKPTQASVYYTGVRYFFTVLECHSKCITIWV